MTLPKRGKWKGKGGATDTGDIGDDDNLNEMLEALCPFSFQLEDNSSNETMNDDYGDDGDGDTTSNSKNLILDACADTIQKFEAMFPNESFFPKVIDNKDIRASKEGDILNSTRLGGFDVKTSCQRQATFLWQVSGERFYDVTFSKMALKTI